MTGPLAVYVHWPFCASKCPYCDFNSMVTKGVDQTRWARALVAELRHYAQETKGHRVISVFFGGGTPSLMDPATVKAVIEAVKGLWRFADDTEVSLEANPSSVDIKNFEAYAAAGVNRLSLGVQSFDDADLRFLGRRHNAREAREAVAAAARIFENHSFDLIYGLPGQTLKDWRRQLDAAMKLAGPHLSAYQLTVEPGTPFHDQGVAEADEETAAQLYEATQERLDAAGLAAYEVSNHARPGYQCRHNLHVWRGGDYLGVGPWAHGRLTQDGGTDATHQIRNPKRWLEVVEARGEATAGRIALSPHERRDERVMLGLRLAEGLPGDLVGSLNRNKVKELIEEEHLTLEGGSLRATDRGRLCLDAVISSLLL